MPRTQVIDNRDVLLLERVRHFLQYSQRVHFAVGYFFLSGFQAIASQLDDVGEIRLLIGNTSNRQTVEQMVEGYQRLDAAQHQQRRERMNAAERESILDDTAYTFQETLALATQSDDEQQSILTLARGIESGRIKVRVYTKGRLHAKAYIFDFHENQAHDGTGIIGSSNLSLSGLHHNTELNAELAGDPNHADLSAWFNRLWDEAEPFNETLMDIIARSWVANRSVTPYDIYIKTLYTLVRERLVEKKSTRLAWETEMPPLADYQRVAMQQATRILDKIGGIFIADVVGLGKSYIGLALLKHYNLYKNAYGVIICPASLVNMWEDLVGRHSIWATVVSMGMLSQPHFERTLIDDPRYSNAGLVLIDESHNFRSRDTQRYRALELFTANRPTIMLTATPRNTSAWDIYTQIKLWHPDDQTMLLDPPHPPNLREFFKRVEPRNEESSTASLRDLLDKILIRRTRQHVLDVYGQDDEQGRQYVTINDDRKYFPTRYLETVNYSIEDTYGKAVYSQLRDFIGDLAFSRYNLYPFVEQSHRDDYTNLQKASATLRGLMRVMLFKRFESSVQSFRITVERLCNNHEYFLQSLDAGFVPAGEEAENILSHLNRDDELSFADVQDDLHAASQTYSIEHFDVPALQTALRDDLRILRQIGEFVEPITPELDDKLVVLQQMLKKGYNPYAQTEVGGHLPTGKVLIFTQFSDTARYLYDNLAPLVGEKTIRRVDSETTDILSVIGRFAPKANPHLSNPQSEPLRVLVATDVLAEGLNLQDGDHIINYDLHWNPVRLIQRVGRIDRLGSDNDFVHVYNFLPETAMERHLLLEERLRNRIQDIHNTIGEDNYILTRSEQLNEEAMYAIYREDDEVLNVEENEATPFSLLEAEEIIRDIQENQSDYFKYIQQLPDGLRTGQRTQDKSTYFYALCEAQDKRGNNLYRRLYLLDENKKLITSNTSEILRLIRCSEDIEASEIPEKYNAIMTKVQADFTDEVNARQTELNYTSIRALGRSYVIEQMRILYEKEDDSETRKILDYLSDIFSTVALPARCHNELNSLRRNQISGDILIDQLTRIVRDYALENIFESGQDAHTVFSTRIVCSKYLG